MSTATKSNEKLYIDGPISREEFREIEYSRYRLEKATILGRTVEEFLEAEKPLYDELGEGLREFAIKKKERFEKDLQEGRPAAKIIAELYGRDTGCAVSKEIASKIDALSEKCKGDKSNSFSDNLIVLLRSYVKPKPVRIVDGWEHVGNISVDAGICWIGDPCYILPDRRDITPTSYSTKAITPEDIENMDENKAKAIIDKTGGLEYLTMLDMLEDKNMHGEIDVLQGCNSYAALDHGPNNDGMGVCVSTGYGDGYYGVYVKRINDGVWGTRIAEAKVVFIPKDTDEDDEDFYDSDGDYDVDEEE